GSRFTGTELIRLTGVTGADIGSLLTQPLVQRLTLGLLGLGHAVPIGTRPAFRRLCAAFQRVRLLVVLIQLLAGRQRVLLIRCYRHVVPPRRPVPRRPGSALSNSAVCRGQAGCSTRAGTTRHPRPTARCRWSTARRRPAPTP